MIGIAVTLTFWVSLLLVSYAYVGYPAILWLVSRLGGFGERSPAGQGALKALLHPFQDNTVGFVTGWTRYGSGNGAAPDSLGLYSRLELMTKELESRLGSCIGADGAIFAIRKELYVPLKDYDINDFVIPLSINQQGYRGVLQREAICFEKDAGSPK